MKIVQNLFPCDLDSDAAPFDPGCEGLTRLPDITMDSGAAISVANHEHFPGSIVVPSNGSRQGQKFVAASAKGSPIDNRGQFSSELLIETGELGRLNFADADVRKPLLAVSSCNAKGNPVHFDGEHSYRLPKTAPELQEIRRLIAKVKGKVRLHFENGTYKMRAWAKPSTFRGQGW